MDDENGEGIAEFFKQLEREANQLHDFDYNGGEDYSAAEGEDND
jgi:hypothetical protein